MAHQIYKKEMQRPCPRCGCKEARLATYHFGATYSAECADCAFGNITGDNEDMAMARLHGQCLEARPLPPNDKLRHSAPAEDSDNTKNV